MNNINFQGCFLHVEDNQFNNIKFAGIQNALLLATGTSQDLDEMLQSFIIAAVEQLKLNNIHVYLLDAINVGTVSTSDTSGFHYYLSYADSHNQLPHFHHKVATSFRNIHPCDDNTLEIVEIDDLQYFVYCLNNIGAIVLEFRHRDFPVIMASRLTPVMHQLALACSTCLSASLKTRFA